MADTGMHVEGPAGSGVWVEAAPFRAHLGHLMSVSGLSASGVALLAQVSPRCADRLLHGRRGRPLRRIDPETARRLLGVTAADARAVHRRTVAARSTVLRLRRLGQEGWSEPDLARLLQVDREALVALLGAEDGCCLQVLALRTACAPTVLPEVEPLATDLVRLAA